MKILPENISGLINLFGQIGFGHSAHTSRDHEKEYHCDSWSPRRTLSGVEMGLVAGRCSSLEGWRLGRTRLPNTRSHASPAAIVREFAVTIRNPLVTSQKSGEPVE
jgi:hypothetical protein